MKVQCCPTWILCLALLSIDGPAHCAEEPQKPLEVPVAKPVVREITDYYELNGHVEASTFVELRAQVAGCVTATPFKEGGLVKKGDVLFEIDPRLYQARLDVALLGELDLHKAALLLALHSSLKGSFCQPRAKPPWVRFVGASP